MCGIAGSFSAVADWRAETVVRAVVKSQVARGPDVQAVETVFAHAPQVVLGHDRLSILDLTPASNQPLWDRERRCCIAYNGEIYNYLELRGELVRRGHAFSSQGDVEVILEAFKEWGIEALGRLVGMFAFALWDMAGGNLWLVRDRFGVKPLYYYRDSRNLYFASTPTVIASEMGLKPNLDYLVDGIELLMYERDSAISPFKGLSALPPGHFAQVTLSSGGAVECLEKRYYDLEAQVDARKESLCGRSEMDLVGEVRECLESAVDLRLRSDVPVGISLSGGLDSSTIAALVARHHQNVHAFTFSSPDDLSTEGACVRATVAKTGVAVHYCRPGIKEIIHGTWQTLADQGAPFPTGSIVGQHFVFQAARQAGVIVLLGGQGADEVLMGYHKFKVFLLQRARRDRDYKLLLAAAGGIMAVMLAELSALGDYWKERHRFRRGVKASPCLIRREGPDTFLSQGLSPESPLWKRQLLDVTRFSLPTLLRYEDRNSMGNSIESRLPFMDHRLVEFGLALPDTLKVRRGFGKWVLREIARGLVPEKIRCARKKRGFDVNQRRWIREGLGAALRQQLEESHAGYRDYLKRPVNIATDFSNRRLICNHKVFGEAITLIWLASCK